MAAEQNSTQNANTKASTSEAFLTSGTRPGTSKPLITVGLTPSPLDIPSLLDTVKDPRAGAVVFFAGTTRDTFNGRAVARLSYSAYVQRALQTMQTIAASMVAKHGLVAIALVHRLGDVPIGEESILIAVTAPNRTPAWRAAEECLEEVKRTAEIWKREVFVDGEEVWRAN